MAYFLTIAFLGLVQEPDNSLLTLIPFFLQQIAFGAALVGVSVFLMNYFNLW
jgi:cell volume regulation protein A